MRSLLHHATDRDAPIEWSVLGLMAECNEHLMEQDWLI